MSIPKEQVIELHELKIGNYLEYDGKIVHVTILSCDIDDEYEDQICFCELDKTTNEKGGSNRSICDKLNRIALTPEWLLQFGFSKDEEHGFFVLYQFECQVAIKFYDKGVHLIGQSMADELSHIKYVHQLQNLYYALTGLELKIKS